MSQNFDNKAFLCDNESQWNDCQKILFNNGYDWEFNMYASRFTPLPWNSLNYQYTDKVIIYASDTQLRHSSLKYFKNSNQHFKLIHSAIILRKNKLEKLMI